MEHKGSNTYIYLLHKLLLAFCSLLAMQVLFIVANSHIFRPDGFGEWMGILWGNIVFGAATVCTILLPFIVLMLLLRENMALNIALSVVYVFSIFVQILQYSRRTGHSPQPES